MCTCLASQRAKVHRHPVPPCTSFLPPDARFGKVHLTLDEPLPASQGRWYNLTCIDRFTRWPEATPLLDSRAATVAEAFATRWVARFGCPSETITNKGRQFKFSLFTKLTQLLGYHKTPGDRLPSPVKRPGRAFPLSHEVCSHGPCQLN